MGQLTTFQDQYQEAQTLSHFTDAATTARFKKSVNRGCAKFMSLLNRAYLRRSRFTDLVAGQQYYTYPLDALKMRQSMTHIGGIERDLFEVPDEKYWNQLNQVVQQGIPTWFFVKGFDEIGLYPAPAASTSAGLELVFTQRHLNMTQDDYTTGTMSATADSQTVTGSGTAWTTGMAGRAFEATDGSDGNWYRIQSVESATSMTLEKVYQGLSGTGLPYRIGECAYIPEEYLESATDYALERFYLGRDQAKFNQYETLVNNAVEECRSVYGSKTSSGVIDASHRVPVYDPLRSNISIKT